MPIRLICNGEGKCGGKNRYASASITSTMINCADKAMYRAKREGRGQVRFLRWHRK